MATYQLNNMLCCKIKMLKISGQSLLEPLTLISELIAVHGKYLCLPLNMDYRMTEKLLRLLVLT